MSKENIIDYSKVIAQLNPKERHHLLLGNGFSIGCDSRFSYPNLYQAAKSKGLSSNAQKVFARLGTNNFEAVMRLLDDGHWLGKTYEIISENESELSRDLEVIKNTLVASIADTHPEHTGKIDDKKKKSAAKFFEPYHNIFSLNYDLLPYWVNMISNPPPYQDGFREDPNDSEAPSLVFSERVGDEKGLYFIHGALHLFMGSGGLRKHSWIRSMKKLTELVQEGLGKGRYPLFVAEGDSVKKMEQIQSNGYLSYCHGKLGRIQNRLVTLGFSFGDSDKHICSQIVENEKITDLYVGLFETKDGYDHNIINTVCSLADQRKSNTKKQSKKYQENHQLRVTFFDSASAKVWES